MLRVGVFAIRDWSYENIKPVIDAFDSVVFHRLKWPVDFPFDLVITCEPHMKEWSEMYGMIKGKIPVIAIQQGLYWDDEPRKGTWMFDKFIVWGQQMKEASMRNGLSEDRIIVTGNPRFDKFWNMKTEDKGYTLVLGDGGDTQPFFQNENFIFRKHPNVCGYEMPDDTEELIRCSHEVCFKSTGAGIIAMIMKKPVKIFPCNRKSYLRADKMGHENFVKWAVTGPEATERVKCAISQFM